MPLIFLLKSVIKALQVIFSSPRASPCSSTAPKWPRWCLCPWVLLDLMGEVGSLEWVMLQNAFRIDANGCSPAGMCHPLSPEPPPTLSPYCALCHSTPAITRGSGPRWAVPWAGKCYGVTTHPHTPPSPIPISSNPPRSRQPHSNSIHYYFLKASLNLIVSD